MDMHNWQAEIHANERKYRQLVQQLNNIVAEYDADRHDARVAMARVAYEVSLHQRILKEAKDAE